MINQAERNVKTENPWVTSIMGTAALGPVVPGTIHLPLAEHSNDRITPLTKSIPAVLHTSHLMIQYCCPDETSSFFSGIMLNSKRYPAALFLFRPVAVDADELQRCKLVTC